MGGIKLAPILIFLAVAGMFALALKTGDPSKLPSALIGKPVPDTSFPALVGLRNNGVQVPGFTPKDLAKGRITLVNFWASWCGSCVAEHANLKALSRKANVLIFGIDHRDQRSDALRFLRRLGNPYHAVGVDFNGRASIEWGVSKMPESFLIDGKGKIIYKHVGPISPLDVDKILLPLIAKARKAAKVVRQSALGKQNSSKPPETK